MFPLLLISLPVLCPFFFPWNQTVTRWQDESVVVCLPVYTCCADLLLLYSRHRQADRWQPHWHHNRNPLTTPLPLLFTRTAATMSTSVYCIFCHFPCWSYVNKEVATKMGGCVLSFFFFFKFIVKYLWCSLNYNVPLGVNLSPYHPWTRIDSVVRGWTSISWLRPSWSQCCWWSASPYERPAKESRAQSSDGRGRTN